MKKSLTVLLGCLLVAGCASLHMQRNLVNDREKITGIYNYIQVGGTYGSDAERIVILDVVDDAYSFRPVAGPGRVRTTAGLEAEEAMQKAELFFSDHCAYRGYEIRRLTLRDNGSMVGYELVPYYTAVLCEDANDVLVNYGPVVDGEIKVYTTLLLKKDFGGSSGLGLDTGKTKTSQ